MAEPEHSPEPWRIAGDTSIGPQGIGIMSADDEAVAVVLGPIVRPIDERTREDARRIVASVNAMRGIPTEALETGVIAELREALQSFVDYYTQAGIGDCEPGDEDDCLDSFDGDEMYNVREGRKALAKLEG
jgi:hypothetical protein